MAMDWAHSKESRKQYHKTSTKMESLRQKEKRPNTKTWRRGLQADLDIRKMGYNWNRIVISAQDRELWRTLVGSLYPRRGEL